MSTCQSSCALYDGIADVDRSKGNHGWIDAAVPEKLHLLSQAEGTRRVTERCVIAPRKPHCLRHVPTTCRD